MLRSKELISLFIVKTNILFCCINVRARANFVGTRNNVYKHLLMAEILYTFNTPLGLFWLFRGESTKMLPFRQ